MELCEACNHPVGADGYRDTAHCIALCAACDQRDRDHAQQAWKGERLTNRCIICRRPAVTTVGTGNAPHCADCYAAHTLAYLGCAVENYACDLADGLILGTIAASYAALALLTYLEAFRDMLWQVEEAWVAAIPA